MKLYQIDNNKYDFCDLIIDTANYNPEQIVDQIIAELLKRGLISQQYRLFIYTACTKR